MRDRGARSAVPARGADFPHLYAEAVPIAVVAAVHALVHDGRSIDECEVGAPGICYDSEGSLLGHGALATQLLDLLCAIASASKFYKLLLPALAPQKTVGGSWL